VEDVIETLNESNPHRRQSGLQFRPQGINLQSTALIGLVSHSPSLPLSATDSLSQQNGVTGAAMATPMKNRTISAFASVYVNRFVEQQQLAFFNSQLPATVNNNANNHNNNNNNDGGHVAIPNPAHQQTSSRSAPAQPVRPAAHSHSQPSSPVPAPLSVLPDVPTYSAVAVIHQRPVDLANADQIVRAQLLDQAIASTEEDAPVEAEAFLADDVIFTVH
jgi:hypothetical protein